MKVKMIVAALALASLIPSFSMADGETILQGKVDGKLLDNLTIGGEKIGDCSKEFDLAYDGESSKWMTAQLPPVLGKEIVGKKIFHKIWYYGDGTPVATIWIDQATFELITFKTEGGSWDGDVGAKEFATACREIRKSNKLVFE